MREIKLPLIKAIELIGVAVIVVLMINRVRFGIDLSDESWYVAEPYSIAEMGSMPFYDNVNQAPAFTVPLNLFYKAFCALTGGNEGIMLFSRLLYICASLAMAVLVCIILRRKTSFTLPILAIGALFLGTSAGTLFNVNYNTIGLIYLPLIIAIVFCDYHAEGRRSSIFGICAGILAVRVTVGTPIVFIALVAIFIYLCCARKWARVVGILIGCAAGSILLLAPVVFMHGFGGLTGWFVRFFAQPYYASGAIAVTNSILVPISYMVKPMVTVMIGTTLMRLVIRSQRWFLLFLRAAIVGLILLLVWVSFIRQDIYDYTFSLYSWYLPFLYFIFGGKYDTRHRAFALTAFVYTLIFFVSSIFNIYGFSSMRYYWLYVPIVLTLCLIVDDIIKEDTKTLLFRGLPLIATVVALVLVMSLRVCNNYRSIYRDDQISMLDTKVSEGIWKGIRSSEKRAEGVEQLEKYLRSMTDDSDRILCLDWVSFGYLMVRGSICSPSTLDLNPYSSKYNDASLIYDYFETTDKVPTKIIYIDYGRDSNLSIEDPEWEFNSFVKTCYSPLDEYANPVFRVKIYSLADEKRAKSVIKK